MISWKDEFRKAYKYTNERGLKNIGDIKDEMKVSTKQTVICSCVGVTTSKTYVYIICTCEGIIMITSFDNKTKEHSLIWSVS